MVRFGSRGWGGIELGEEEEGEEKEAEADVDGDDDEIDEEEVESGLDEVEGGVVVLDAAEEPTTLDRMVGAAEGPSLEDMINDGAWPPADANCDMRAAELRGRLSLSSLIHITLRLRLRLRPTACLPLLRR